MSMKSLQGCCTPGSRDECRTVSDGCQALDQVHNLSCWPACRQLGNYIHHRHLLLLSPKADTHFTIPQRAEG